LITKGKDFIESYLCAMNYRKIYTFSLLLITLSLFVGCKPEAPAVKAPEADTRVWVQEAYRKVDTMALIPSLNIERAAIIKKRLDAETRPPEKLNLALDYAQELLKCGKIKECLDIMASISKFLIDNKVNVDPKTKRNLYSIIAIAYLRYGEIENCVQNHNHESCYLPIQGEGVHTLPFGSTQAINEYKISLKEYPDDLEFKYLLNLAYMTLGQYPKEVPKEYLINPDWYKSKINFPRYQDIAAEVGVNRNGLAGGVVVDDFTNDGWLDIVITSWGPHQEMIFYKSNGDGTFTDQTKAFGLDGQVGILNLNQTDINNDGWLDLLLMRGGWWQKNGDIPKTLMMNTGKGRFEDVTLKSGITKLAPSQTSAWADYNLDGWIDVIVANESLPDFQRGIDVYINQKDGTFKHESATWGLTHSQFIKGVTATYANEDKYPDLYFSPLTDSNSLWINQSMSGNNRFALAGPNVHVGAPFRSFPCWSFDFDNNGHEDLFVSSYSNDQTPVNYWMQSQMGKVDPVMFPKLYSNQGNMQYKEVGVPMGLTEVAFTMGCNFGDINTDGFLDFYLATGNPLFQALVPNKMYLNMDGKRFEDISYAGGFSNLQKGHGVSFGDLDHDGDEDLYVVIGGAVDGDMYFNCLYENPNPDKNNWVVLKLIGTTANKAAIGARVAINVEENGKERMIYRVVTSGASFGANSLALEVGLRKSAKINSVKVQWPCKDCPDQVFSGLTINKAYELTEGQATAKELQYTAVKMHSSGGGMNHQHH
jgi:hypothetical protein